MKWVRKLTRPWYILFFLAVAIACLLVFMLLLHFLHWRSLDLMPGFSPEQAASVIGSYSTKAKALYDCFQAVDTVFLLAYAFLFTGLLALLSDRCFPERPALRCLSLIPLAGAGFDFLENAGIFSMLRIYPRPFTLIAISTSAAGVAKLALFYLSLLLIATGAVIRLLQRRREKIRRGPTG